MRKVNFQSGNSLMETIIYLAILMVLVAFTVNGIMLVTKSFRTTTAQRDINSSAEDAMERIIREIRYANTVDLAGSMLDASPGVLLLNSIEPITDLPQNVRFSVANNRLIIQAGSTTPEALTSSNVQLTNLVFRRVASSSVSEAIKVEMTISGEEFYGTAILRRSY
jgi:Tfp pilus assembly protein PilW